jgi:hypothetical protein
MTRGQAIGMYMTVFTLAGTFITGALAYNIDLRDATVQANRTIPACISGKDTCRVTRFEHGQPHIEMAHREVVR